MRTANNAHDVIIVGGGPAGSTAAALLAESGMRVLLLEEKRMPREKLCGGFITAECFPTLSRLGVIEKLLSAGAEKIRRMSVFSSSRKIEADVSAISDKCGWAMSLSRSRFDQILFERARSGGAECREAIAVRRCVTQKGEPARVEGIDLGTGGAAAFQAPLVIDASGRQSRLMLNPEERAAGERGSRLYALQAHFENVAGVGGRVDLFLFPRGYGGLSPVEEGLVNLCLIVREDAISKVGNDFLKTIGETILTNPAARERFAGARLAGRWHSAGPLTFGKRRLSRAGVIAIGDAAGMIDPFTGTGIQIALRSGELAATAVLETLDAKLNIDEALKRYSSYYNAEFGARLAVASALRPVVFSPMATRLAGQVLGSMPALTRLLIRATRQ